MVIYSFNGNKTFTSGGGGALSTNKKIIYNKAKVLSENGKSTKSPYIYNLVGHNYKMTNLHAAILKGQLSRYSEIRKKLFFNHKQYIKKIKNINFKFFTNQKFSKNILWLNFVLCNSDLISKKLINYLRNKNINTNYFWIPMHLQPIRKNFIIENMEFTNYFFKKVVLIPSSSFLKNKELNHVIKLLNEFNK